MKIIRLIFLIIYLFFLPEAIIPQNYSESGFQSIINYSPKEYNAHRQNWAIIQNESGIMYFGNNSGLLEFDGVGWRLYHLPNKATIRSLANGDSGKIYVGAKGDLGYFLSDSLGRLSFHSLMEFVPEDKRDFSDVWQTYVSNGNVYFNTANYILIWSLHKRKFSIIQSENKFHLMTMINGKLYVREWGKGLKVLNNDALTLLNGGDKFADERIYVMLPFTGEDGTVLIVTRTMGLFKYDGNNFIPFKTEVDNFIKENLIYYPGTKLSDGNILLGTINGGAIVIDRNGNLIRTYNIENGIINNNIYFTFQDRSGAIWLATDNGISRIDYSSPVSYFDYRSNFTTTPNDIIRYNGILFTATTNGVYYLDGLTSSFKRLNNSNNNARSFLKIGNELLVGTNDGLFKVERGKLSTIRKTIGNEYAIDILKMSRLNPNRVYLATEGGLWSTLRKDNQWIDQGQILNNQDQITSIVEDNDGSVWAGTMSSGLFRVTFQKNDNGSIVLNKPTIEHFNRKNGLQDGWVWVDNINGTNYFSTTDSIYKYDEAQKLFYSDISDKFISAFYNITDNKIDIVFQQDVLGQIWIGVKGKLEMGTIQTDGSYKWISYPFNRFADESIYKIYVEKNGVVWFGTGSGIIKYDFRKKNLNSIDYSALVRRVEIGEDSTIFLGGNIDSTISPEITYKNNSIKFRYSATSYEGKRTNKFETYLEGFDDGWSSWSAENTKEYTNLSPGKYTFNVKAINMIGIVSSTGIYSFEILSPWYRTWWAYIFYILVLATAILTVDRTQRRRLIKKERERAENERKTKELEEARQLQLSMLPKEVPKLPHLEIAAFMRTATEVGGDYYDFSTKDDASINICVGDATGHGMKAGTLVTMLKSLFIANSTEKEIEEFFASTNAAIKNSHLVRMMVGFSMLNISGNKAKYINAGMPSIYHFKKNEGKVEEIKQHNMPLGAMKTGNYSSTELILSKGDVILMMSDGFPELHNSSDELFGYERVYSTFAKAVEKEPEEIIKYLNEESVRWMEGKVLQDDVTFVVIKVI